MILQYTGWLRHKELVLPYLSKQYDPWYFEVCSSEGCLVFFAHHLFKMNIHCSVEQCIEQRQKQRGCSMMRSQMSQHSAHVRLSCDKKVEPIISIQIPQQSTNVCFISEFERWTVQKCKQISHWPLGNLPCIDNLVQSAKNVFKMNKGFILIHIF